MNTRSCSATFLVLLLATWAGHTSVAEPVATLFSKFVWYGHAPDAKGKLMLVASTPGEFGKLSLTSYRLRSDQCDCLTRTQELAGPSAFKLVSLRVDRDTKRHVLYAAVRWAAASTVADWVVEINGAGVCRTIFSGINGGSPQFRMNNGLPEVREVWEIARLMDQGWRPGAKFAGHVLVERTYRLNSHGVFELRTLRPATEDERRLSRSDRQLLLRARMDFESRHR